MAKSVLFHLFFLVCTYNHAVAQVDAIEEDTVLDKYYINYPLDTDSIFHVGDTVAAVYLPEASRWETICELLVRKYPKSRKAFVYVVQAVINEFDTTGIGFKLKIYSITEHNKNGVRNIPEYSVPYLGCKLQVNHEIWKEKYDWQNITGLYTIQKYTDNYKIGDTVYRTYNLPASLVGGVYKKSSNKKYSLKAIVRGIDTTSAQRLLLEFIVIKLDYRKYNFFLEQFRDYVAYPEHMTYNYAHVQVGDLVWTKPYYWYKTRHHYSVGNGEIIPSINRPYETCIRRVYIYDCMGNRYDSDNIRVGFYHSQLKSP